MQPDEYDVVICYDEQPGSDMPHVVAAGLARRGFRVFDAGHSPVETDGRRLEIIGETPDLVVILTRDSLDRLRSRAGRMHDDLSHALATDRNIVPVYGPGVTPAGEGDIAPGFEWLQKRQPVTFSARAGEQSVAHVAQRLSSHATVDDRKMFREAKWIGSFVGVVLVALVAIAAVGIASRMLVRRIDVRPLPPLVLRWSAFVQRNDNGRWREVVVRDGGPMSAGDQLRLAFSPSADGYAYVFGRDLRGEVHVLFPSRALKAESRVVAGRVYEAPADGSWLPADEASGIERIYVIASYDPIENLESLLDDREESAAERQALLDSTVEGLLDGKHGGEPLRIRTRAGRQIVRALDPGSSALTASAILESGASVTHTLNQERGLLSAMVELRLAPGK
jgi:hypothetical protein